MQTVRDDDSVFIYDGHNVGDGAECHKISIFGADAVCTFDQGFASFKAFGHFIRTQQFKDDSNAGELLEGIVAIGSVRIDNSASIGQFRMTFMVVGDDHVDAFFTRMLDLINGSDARINGNN